MNLPGLLLLAVLCLVPVSAPFAEDGIESKQKELQAIYDQLEEQRQNLKKTKIKEDSVLKEISLLSSQIKSSQNKLDYSLRLVDKRKRELQSISQMLLDSEYRLGSLLGDFRVRLREIYKNKQTGLLEVLLESADFSDLLKDVVYFEKIVKQDIMLIDSIRNEMQIIEENKLLAEKKKKQIELQTSLIQQEKQNLEQNRSSKKKLQTVLQLKREQYEREIEELEKNSQQIEDLIKQMLAKSGKIKSTGIFRRPVEGWISSPYGYRKHPIFKTVKFHSGIDIAAPSGRPIAASDSGVVIFSGRWGGYGKTVIIDHGRGYSTVYAHQSRIYVQKDQYVEQGQTVGLVGSTGYSTGPHLHFEIRHNGQTIDPQTLMRN